MARNEKEIEDLAGYKEGVVLGGKWKIMELLDEGGFGKVYRVQEIANPTQFAALKIESSNMEGGSAIKLERATLEHIHKSGIKEHVPTLYRSSKRKNICYMIVTLLGDNLKKIKERYYANGYPLKTWTKVAIQCLYAIKIVHDAGYVHRDIKAPNFVFGHGGDPKKARVIHIIDFGLARRFVEEDPKRKGGLRPRTARARTDFRGTWSYASPAMHDYMELGRKDDIWSLLFMLMDLYASLPWANLDSLEAIGKMKQNISDAVLMMKMPPELREIPAHLKTLDVYSKPNYWAINQCFDRVFTRCKASWTEPYEWENKDLAARNLAAQRAKPPGYFDPNVFFQDDPIRINTGPSRFAPGEDVTRASVTRRSAVTGGMEQPPSGASAEHISQNTASPINKSIMRKPPGK